MSTFDVRFVLTVYTTEVVTPDVGIDSIYSKIPHPATGKKISGWKWDERNWANPLELKSVDYVPSIHDADTNFLVEEAFQSGIGDNDDLKLVDIQERQVSNIRYWVPKVYHGHFYNFDEEWYLYSDDVRKEIVASGELLSGVFQTTDLGFLPKPGVPVSARTYSWNPVKSRYEIFQLARKKIDFTGIIEDGEELPTTVGDDYAPENIDTSRKEFRLDYTFDPPRAVFNQVMTGFVGMSGQNDTLDFLGFGGLKRTEYHLKYSPVDTSQPFHLITWDPATEETVAWSQLDSVEEFPTGSGAYYKLDPGLGIITVGDYDEVTTSGAGLMPPIRHKIGAAYSYTVDLTYEPIHSRDYVEPVTGDVNPLHNISNQGFLEASPNVEGAYSVHLFADMLGSAKDGYLIGQASKHNRVYARVKDAAGNELEHQIVEFEILNPIFGTFSNLDVSVTSLTNEHGLATVYYVAPQTIGETSHVVSQIARQNDGTTKLAIANMVAPLDLEQIYLYKVRTDDPVGGINNTTALFTGYLSGEGIVEDPNGTPASTGFEQDYREGNQLLAPNYVGLADLDTGTKVIVSGVDTGVLDPSFGVQRQYELAPLIPFQATTAGSLEDPILELTYSGQLDTIDNVSFKSYLVIADPTTRIRARVTNALTRELSYSNVITIDILAPEDSKGVQLIEHMADIESGVLRRPKNIDSYSSLTLDDFTTISEDAKDLIYAEYLEDRYVTESDGFMLWSGDTYTIGYWPLNSGLFDASAYHNDLTNYHMSPAVGFVESGYRSTGGEAYLLAPGIYDDLNLQSGTIDFCFKTTTSSISANNTFNLFQITATGTNGLVNNLELLQSGYYGSQGTRLRFNYEASGVGYPVAYLEEDMSASGIYLTDGQWHSLRVTWDWDGWRDPINLWPAQIRNPHGTVSSPDGWNTGMNVYELPEGFTVTGSFTQPVFKPILVPGSYRGFYPRDALADGGGDLPLDNYVYWDANDSHPTSKCFVIGPTNVTGDTTYIGSFYAFVTDSSAEWIVTLESDVGVINSGLFGLGPDDGFWRSEIKGTTQTNATQLYMRFKTNAEGGGGEVPFAGFQLEKPRKQLKNLFPSWNVRMGNEDRTFAGFTTTSGVLFDRDYGHRGQRAVGLSCTPTSYVDLEPVHVTGSQRYTFSMWYDPNSSFGNNEQVTTDMTVKFITDAGTVVTDLSLGERDTDFSFFYQLIATAVIPGAATTLTVRVEFNTNLGGNVPLDSFQLERSDWVTEFDPYESMPFSDPGGSVHLSGLIDGYHPIKNGSPSYYMASPPTPGTVDDSRMIVVGDLSASGNFVFDEIRYSTIVRTDEWPPEGESTTTESLNDWLHRSRRADSITLGLIDVVDSGYAPARLPLGFRLKSDEITVASRLDTSTFLILNDPLPSGYYRQTT